MKYAYSREISGDYYKKIGEVKKLLSEEGFGVLTEIDVQETLKKKLDVDYDRYVILGACNPPYAHKALQVEKEVGLLLPCNLIVYEINEKVVASVILPTVAMGMIENEKLQEIAREIEEKLIKVIDRL